MSDQTAGRRLPRKFSVEEKKKILDRATEIGVIAGVKRYLADMAEPKNVEEESSGKIGVGRSSKLYLIGKVLGQEVRIQELAGSLSIHVNNQLLRDICLLH